LYFAFTDLQLNADRLIEKYQKSNQISKETDKTKVKKKQKKTGKNQTKQK